MEGEDGVTATAGDVAEGVSEEGLPHADGAEDGENGVALEEAEGDELIEEHLVAGDLGQASSCMAGSSLARAARRVAARPPRRVTSSVMSRRRNPASYGILVLGLVLSVPLMAMAAWAGSPVRSSKLPG